MAFLVNSLFGKPSGKIGGFIYKQVNGKTVISIAPKHYKKSNSPASKRVKINFAAAAKFSSIVNSIQDLKKIWSLQKMKQANTFNRISKENFPLIKEGRITTDNIIIPWEYPLIINGLSLSKDNLSLTYEFLESGDTVYPLTVHIVLAFNLPGISFSHFTSKISTDSGDITKTADFQLDLRSKAAFLKDPSPIFFIAVIGSESEKRKIWWASAAAVQVGKK